MDESEVLQKHIIGRHYRKMTGAAAIDQEKRTATLSFSSTTPVPRWWGIEILSHDPNAVRMDRAKEGLPFLMNHDPNDMRGRIMNGRIEGGKFSGDAIISRSAAGNELLMDLADGIRTDTSMGYNAYAATQLKPEQMSEELKAIAIREQLPVYLVTDWEPLEGSSVAVPADPTVGLGRDIYYTEGRSLDEIEKYRNSQIKPPIQNPERERAIDMADDVTKTPEQLEAERCREIEAIQGAFKDRIRGGSAVMEKIAKAAIDLKVPSELFRGDVYTRVDDGRPIETPGSNLDLTNKEKKRYSLRNVILSQMGVPVDIGFERECHNEIVKRTNHAARGILVPYDIQAYKREIPEHVQRELQAIMKRYGVAGRRDMTVGTPTAGGDLVGTDFLSGSFIDVLRNKALAPRVGVTMLNGLVGNVAIPKQTSASTFYWVAEGSAITESTPAVGQVTLSPKLGGGFVDYSKQLLLQSTPAVDALLMNDIGMVCGLGADKAVFMGSGAANQPTGIIATSGIGSVNGTNLGWEAVLEFITDVMGGNGDIGPMSYVTNPTIWGLGKSRALPGTNNGFLIDAQNNAAGYPVNVSNQISAGYMIFGNYQQAILGEWGILDIQVITDATLAISGLYRIIGMIAVDVGVRQAASFSASSNVS